MTMTRAGDKSMNQRLHKLRGRMAELGLDAIFISQPQNRRYLSGFTGSAGNLLITADQAVIATDFRYYEQSAQQAPDFRLHQATGPMEGWLPGLLTAAGDLGGKRLGFESADLTFLLYRALRKAVEGLPAGQRPRLIAVTSLVEGLRAIKEPEELAAIQAAVDLSDAALQHVAGRIEPGWTEKQAAWEIEKHMRENGGESVSFDTIVAGGPWSAMPHAYPRDRALEQGEMVVIDMGVRLNGYCSDLTRTLFLGKPDDRFERVYDIVLGAQLTAEELVQAGMNGEEAHNLAHRVIEEAGYGENFGHGLGHGVGLAVHESPRLAKTSQDVLAEGMVVTIEPGIYVTDWGGVRIEDMVVIEDGRARVMTRAPKLLGTGGG
jgi:Xaa-Pro aminopeptidase